jgi:hypothetical protein
MAPVHWFVLPLLRAIAELAFRAFASLFSETRWVEARSGAARKEAITYKTSREHAVIVANALVDELARGRRQVSLPDAELVSFGHHLASKGRR